MYTAAVKMKSPQRTNYFAQVHEAVTNIWCGISKTTAESFSPYSGLESGQFQNGDQVVNSWGSRPELIATSAF